MKTIFIAMMHEFLSHTSKTYEQIDKYDGNDEIRLNLTSDDFISSMAFVDTEACPTNRCCQFGVSPPPFPVITQCPSARTEQTSLQYNSPVPNLLLLLLISRLPQTWKSYKIIMVWGRRSWDFLCFSPSDQTKNMMVVPEVVVTRKLALSHAHLKCHWPNSCKLKKKKFCFVLTYSIVTLYILFIIYH